MVIAWRAMRPPGPSRLEQAAKNAPWAPVDGLDHLDGDEPLVAALEVTIGQAAHGDAIAEPGGRHPGRRDLTLRVRDRRRRDPAAVAFGRVQGEPSPARADLEQMVVSPEAELAADAVEPGSLGIAERHARALEDGTRIGHRLVEHRLEDGTGEVVVGLHVTPVVCSVGPAQAQDWIDQCAQQPAGSSTASAPCLILPATRRAAGAAHLDALRSRAPGRCRPHPGSPFSLLEEIVS